MATAPTSNGSPVIPNEKGFFSHSMHSDQSKYGTAADYLYRRGSVLLNSTIGSDTRFWMRDPAGSVGMRSFAEINSGVKKGTDFKDFSPKLGNGSFWGAGYTSSGFNPNVITHQPTATERNRTWTGSYLWGIAEGDSVILHNTTPPKPSIFGQQLAAYLYNYRFAFSGSQFVYTSGILALQPYKEDLYATASFVSGSVDEGYWSAARLMHVSYSTEPLVGVNWMTTSSSGASPYYAPAGVHSKGKMLEYAINHYSEHLITTYSAGANEMYISSSVTTGLAYRINNLAVIDIHTSKSSGAHTHDTMFNPWEVESSASTIGWGYREADNGMLLPNSNTVTSGSSYTCFDWMWYYERVWGRNSNVPQNTYNVIANIFAPDDTALTYHRVGPVIDVNTLWFNEGGQPGYINSSGSTAWRMLALETLQLTSSSPNDSYYIYSQSVSMSIDDKVIYPLSFNVWPHSQSMYAGQIPGQRHTESLSENKTLLTYLTFADGQPRYVKKSNCECTQLTQWINYPQFGDYSSSRSERYRLTFSDGYSFTAGSLLRLFSYNPMFASATTSYAGIPSPNNSGNWPHSLTSRTPIEIYNNSASFEFASDVAFIKCNDLDPGTTQTAGMVYLTNIHRIGDEEVPNSIQSTTEYNWTYESDYHFSINKHSYDGTTYNEYNTTASYHPHMTRVDTATSDIWSDFLSGWLMLENGLYVGFEACNQTDIACSVGGCMDPTALNYNPMAIWQPGYDVCEYCTNGCMDDGTNAGFPGRPGGYVGPAMNYNPSAGPTITPCNTGCTYCVYGCMDNGSNASYPGRPAGYSGAAINYNASATCENESCTYCIYGCTTNTSSNYNPSATCDDGSCYDCLDFTASLTLAPGPCKNYNDGTATGSAVGGLAPYTYSWYKATSPYTGFQGPGTDNTIHSLSPGDTAWLLVQDNNGCSDAVYMVMPQAGDCQVDCTLHFRAPSATNGAYDCMEMNGFTSGCCSGADHNLFARNGGLSCSVAGGTPPYTYQWSSSNSQHNTGGNGVMSGMCAAPYPACSYDGYPGHSEASASIDCGIQHNTNAGCSGSYPSCDGWNKYKVVVTDAVGSVCTSSTIIMPIAYDEVGCTTSSYSNYNFNHNKNGGTCS